MPGEKPPKKRNGERGPDKRLRKGSPRGGRKGSIGVDESPARARRTQALLMLSEGRRVDEVASALSVTKAAVYKWLDNEAFAAELDAMLDAAKRSALRILRGNAEKFAETLARVADTGDAVGGRVQAAKDGLDRIGLAPPKEVKVELNDVSELGRKSEEELQRIIAGEVAG